jgi:hypothetical protein
MLLADASIVIMGAPCNIDSPDTFVKYDGKIFTALIEPVGDVVIGVS